MSILGIVLSHYQAEVLTGAREMGQVKIHVSPDLGLTDVEVGIDEEGVRFPDGPCLAWAEVERIQKDEVGCYLIEGGEPRKIQTFSEYTNRPISLKPTDGAPTLLVAGFFHASNQGDRALSGYADKDRSDLAGHREGA